jgi:hypothetical protein
VTKLAGLEDIDWARLSDASGSAVKVPVLLTALATAPPAERATALGDLKKAIHPDYETFSAAGETVPFLAAMALDEKRNDVAALLDTLARLAVGQPRITEGVDIRDPVDRWRVQMLHHGIPTYEAVGETLPRLVGLGAHADAKVRCALHFLLAQFADHASTSLPRVRTWLEREKNADVRVSLLLALRLLARFAGDDSDVSFLEKQIGKGDGKNAETIAAALALQHLIPTHPLASKLLRGARPRTPADFVWGDLREMAEQVLEGRPLWARSTSELVTWLESTPKKGDELDEHSVIQHVLYRFLAFHTGSYRLATEIPDEVRRAIVGALRRGDQIGYHSDVFLDFYGLPYQQSLGRWVGADPPRALEKIVPGPRSWPTWKWLKAAVLGEVSNAEAIAAVSSAFSPAERAELLRDPFLVEYDFQGHVPLYDSNSIEADAARHVVQSLMVEILSSCGQKVVEAEAERASKNEGDFIHPVVIVATLGRLAARDGRVRDARWQRLATRSRPNGSSALFREVVEATPMELRGDIFSKQVFGPWTSTSLGPDKKKLETLTLAGSIDELIDLCPTPAVSKKFVDAIVSAWPEYPKAEGLVIARRVGRPLGAPLLAALRKFPKNDAAGLRRYLVEMLGAAGVTDPADAARGESTKKGRAKKAASRKKKR